MSSELQKRMVRMFKALGNPNRFRLFVEIARGDGEQAVAESHACLLHTLIERLSIGAPTVSHHLKELVNAELIISERRGKFVSCRINPQALELIGLFVSTHGAMLEADQERAIAPAE